MSRIDCFLLWLGSTATMSKDRKGEEQVRVEEAAMFGNNDIIICFYA